jgi:hypothetical protein
VLLGIVGAQGTGVLQCELKRHEYDYRSSAS